jgi:uncharacterized DUF497 family protein
MRLFEWDKRKSEQNFEKHGIRFDEVFGVFDDDNALRSFDVKHSQIEDRWLIIGKSLSGYILTVVYTERETGIRIISARRSNTKERERYETQK